MTGTEHVVVRLTHRLAALGALDVGIGTALALRGRTPGACSFGRQTAMWGAVDLALAGVGVARRSAPPTAARLRTVLLVNAGLDLGYLSIGAYLAGRRPTVRGPSRTGPGPLPRAGRGRAGCIAPGSGSVARASSGP